MLFFCFAEVNCWRKPQGSTINWMVNKFDLYISISINAHNKGVSVDFYNRDDDILDPFSHLHAEEERLVSERPLQVSQDAMLLNIREVFSQSKPGRTNEKASEFSVWLFGCHNVTPRETSLHCLHNVSAVRCLWWHYVRCKHHQLSLLLGASLFS